MFRIAFVLVLTLGLNQSIAQDTNKVKKIKVLPVPTFGYEPETKTHVGAVALFTINLHQDSLTRTSNAKVEFNYTWRRQIILESEWNYFSKSENWFSNGVLHFSKYPDFYWGVGMETQDEDELLFSSNRSVIDINLYKQLGNKFFVGGGLRYLNYYKIESDTIIPFSELLNSENFGLRLAGFKDSRNNLLNSTSGVYAFTELDYNFGQNQYLRATIDLRKYHTFKDRVTVAARLYQMINFNTPNFYDYAVMGGDDFVRGNFYGRYRDRNLTTLQTECRAHIFWRIGLAGFVGVSSLYGNSEASSNNLYLNYGGGLRFLMDKENNVNLRFDYAIGVDGQTGFYVSFGESF